MNISKESLIIVGVIALLVIVFSIVASTGGSSKKVTNVPQGSQGVESGKVTIMDSLVGTGVEAVSGKTVIVHYTGTLLNGTKFDSSLDRETPFSFILGAGEVIQGWEEGIKGMKVGGKRQLIIPPEFGYGSADMGAIPPNSTLVFEVELLGVK